LLIRRLFLVGLGLVYAVAFVSLWVQIHGLVGPHGIVPAQTLLDVVDARLGAARLWRLPTLAWITGASDGALDVLCGGGTIAATLLALGVATPLAAIAAWVLYLSLYQLGQEFLSFQWDILLLEAGFLAIFATPLAWTPRSPRWRSAPDPLIVWLLILLIAKLMFLSGVVKLSSGDPTWRDLTALSYHYETTCLPTWTGWYMHALPLGFHKASAAMMFAIELLLPFAAFGPRRLRLVSAAAFVGLMVFIAATGNYGFFNLLAIVLCLPLFDDSILRHAMKRRGRERQPGGTFAGNGSASALDYAGAAVTAADRAATWPRLVTLPVASVVLLLTPMPLVRAMRLHVGLPDALVHLYELQEPFHLVNGYGLFATMTTERPEIVVEGSDDGDTWRTYEFRWKPGDPLRRPEFVQPHMPRLDWQMWFAALGSPRSSRWFLAFCERLLEGVPPVLALLRTNPFPTAPPRYLRATLYDYHFTTPDERRATGAWWTRRPLRPYIPTLMLAADGRGLRAAPSATVGGAP